MSAGQTKSYFRDYHAKNKKKRNAQRREWAVANPVRNKTAIFRCAKAWREKNTERIKTVKKRWRPTYKAKQKAISGQRRSKIQSGDTIRIAKFIERETRKRYHRCYYCRKRFTGLFHVDHITPLVAGGVHDTSNVCVSCPKCNLSKNRKTVPEFVTNGQLLLPC